MGRFFLLLVITVLAVGGYFFYRKNELEISSPVAKAYVATKQVVPNEWFPKVLGASDEVKLEQEMLLSASSAILVDYDSAEVVFQKNEFDRQPVASTVKIMTALVALENSSLDSEFSVSEKAATIGENSMGLTTGEKLTLKELLYGLMLVSGNDAALTIAEGVAGSEEKFVVMMNKRVGDLGLKNTKFINASGLDVDSETQYSTAYDMAVIARYLWQNYPEIRDITSTYQMVLPGNGSHKTFDLYNDTNLLTTYPGVRGIKPGFTWEAGLCLVTYVENGGKKFIGVVLGSGDRRGEMKELLDYGFDSFGIKVEHPALDL